MTDVLDLIGAERLTIASMFAVEFIDPFTDRIVRNDLRVWAEGFGPPIRTISDRYAWNENELAADRTITVHAVSTDRRYADFKGDIKVPAHVLDIAPTKLLFRIPLTATGLYIPPDGATAFVGELVTTGTPPQGFPGVSVELVLVCEGVARTSNYGAVTDTRGGFVAVGRGFEARVPDFVDGLPAGYLRFTNAAGVVRYSAYLPLQIGRLVYATKPLNWAHDLGPNPPA